MARDYVTGKRFILFTVFVRPQPQGSTRAFMVKGRPIITSDNKKLKPYRQEISQTAQALQDKPFFEKHVPVEIGLEFWFEKPESAPKRRERPVVKPDLSKLVRSTEDALVGILIHDDAQIVEIHTTKHYGTPERVVITLREASNGIESAASGY